jgi:hypothetical protein
VKYWKSKWVMAVALIHTLFGVIVFRADYVALYKNNIVAGIENAQVAFAVWFLLFGQVLFFSGYAMLRLEQKGDIESEKGMALQLLALTLVGVVIMPDSGFWLMFPPIIAMLSTGFKNSQNLARELE